MGYSIRTAIGLALLVAIVSEEPECAAQLTEKVALPKRVPSRRKADAPPADALKPFNSDLRAARAEVEAARAMRAGEPANVGIVAGPLRALFGGAAAEPALVAIEEPQADIEAQNDAMTQQFVQQFHPILKAELGFVRLVCADLTPEQRPKIRKPAEAALKVAAKQLAKQQNQMQRGMGGARNTPQDASKLIRDAIHKALKETLSEDQLARYTDEANQRAATRKRAAILCLVSRMDGQLYLTAEQRDKITDSISSRWQDNWEKWLTMMNMYGDRYFPTIPDQCVTPHLNTDQKLVWQSVQKIEFGAWWGGGNPQNLDNDGWWGDEPVNKEAVMDGAVIINRVIGF